MDIAIHMTFLPHNDPDAALAFYRDTLGFEVRNEDLRVLDDPDGSTLAFFAK
jgi:catechol 2,3-dioxygenase-like lactoylglutathione lyase family enzyme